MYIEIKYTEDNKRYKQIPQHIIQQNIPLIKFYNILQEVVRDKDNNIQSIRLVNKLVFFHVYLYTSCFMCNHINSTWLHTK